MQSEHKGRSAGVWGGEVGMLVVEEEYLYLVYAFGSASYNTLIRNVLVSMFWEYLVIAEPARFHVRSVH